MTIIDLGTADGTAGEPVTLADLKTWARIERADEDALILGLGRAARQTVEAATGLVLTQRRFRLVLDPVPANGWVEVPRRPLGEIVAVVAYDETGTPKQFDVAEAVVERALGIEAIRVSPAVRQAAANGVEVEFSAGFTSGSAPENLLLAIKAIVAASYETRAFVAPAEQPALVPKSAAALIAPYRRVGL